jgi:hypothetical protein
LGASIHATHRLAKKYAAYKPILYKACKAYIGKAYKGIGKAYKVKRQLGIGKAYKGKLVCFAC